VVHHACQAGAYDEADGIREERIDQGRESVLQYKLAAYQTKLDLLVEFFVGGDLSKEPQVSKQNFKCFILNDIAVCLMRLGRLREAMPFYERAAKGYLEINDSINASIIYYNLAGLYTYLGVLNESVKTAQQALKLARHANGNEQEYVSLTYQAWAKHLMGNISESNREFKQAEEVCKERFKHQNVQYLFSLWGIRHADHLLRTKEIDYAWSITFANLGYATQDHWIVVESQCQGALGDLDLDTGNHESAREHYESALKIARSISHRPTLIEALLARGRFFAKHLKNTDAAFGDLNEALGYCVESSYRIYEADVRVALAWVYLANGEKEKAKSSAECALQMSNEMGYHWGRWIRRKCWKLSAVSFQLLTPPSLPQILWIWGRCPEDGGGKNKLYSPPLL